MDLVQLIESTTGGYNDKIIEDIDHYSIPPKKDKANKSNKSPAKEKKSLDDIVTSKVTGLDRIIKTE